MVNPEVVLEKLRHIRAALQRIAGWIALDAERRRREAVVAQVTARLTEQRPRLDVADITFQFGVDLAGDKDFGVITTYTVP